MSYLQTPLDEEWYVSYITRPEAEAALRKINQVSLYAFCFCHYMLVEEEEGIDMHWHSSVS